MFTSNCTFILFFTVYSTKGSNSSISQKDKKINKMQQICLSYRVPNIQSTLQLFGRRLKTHPYLHLPCFFRKALKNFDTFSWQFVLYQRVLESKFRQCCSQFLWNCTHFHYPTFFTWTFLCRFKNIMQLVQARHSPNTLIFYALQFSSKMPSRSMKGHILKKTSSILHFFENQNVSVFCKILI